MAIEFVCEHCGFAGTTTTEACVDRVQCPMCGELVVELPPGSGLPDRRD